MEPPNNNASNLVPQEVLDDHLEKIVQEFNEFQRKSLAGCTDATTLEDLIDMYIGIEGVSSPVDFNESESTLPPLQEQSAHVQSMHGFNIDTKSQLSEIMTDEMTEDMSQSDSGNFPGFSPTVNTNSHEGAGGSNSRVTRIRYGDLRCHGVADRIIGSCSAETVFHSVMKSFRTPGTRRKNLRQQVGEEENGGGNSSRKYIKRRYKQNIETEKDIDRQMEITNVKNRETGAKARAKRQAHEAYIQSQLLELRQKYEHLRKLVMFLEFHKKINVRSEPLRTISDNLIQGHL